MADQTIASTEEMVGRGHATKSDTLNRAFLIQHDDDGVHEFADGESLVDSGELEILTFGVTGSAVNNLKITNNATTEPVKVEAIGDDTNINIQLYGKGTGRVYAVVPGYAALKQGVIKYKDADEIYIPGNFIDCDGKLCYWTSEVTFQAGSGGSNAGSTDLGNDERHYVYIDHSAVTSGTALVAASFLNSTTAPSSSDAKNGEYNGSDRCVGYFLTSGAGDILDFHWDKGSGLYHWRTKISELGSGSASSVTDVDLSSCIPNFGQVRVQLEVSEAVSAVGGAKAIKAWTYLRENGTGDYMIIGGNKTDLYGLALQNQVSVLTDASQIIEYYVFNDADNGSQDCDIDVRGFWFSI